MRGSGLRAVQLADQLYGNARQEYELTEHFFPYGNGFLEYNAIQRLSVRGIPEAGVGYKLWKAEEKDSTDSSPARSAARGSTRGTSAASTGTTSRWCSGCRRTSFNYLTTLIGLSAQL